MTTKIPVELSSTPGIVDGSNATAITIDSSERVGIGTSSPDRNLTIFASSPVLNIKNSTANLHLEQSGHNGYVGNNSSSGFIQIFTNNGNSTSQFNADGSFQIGAASIANLKFSSSGDVISVTAKKDGTDDIDLAFLTQASGGTTAERMRIASGGGVAIGTTTPDGVSNLTVKSQNATAGQEFVSLHHQASSGTIYFMSFMTGSGNGSDVGYITHTGTTGAFTAASDISLKENIRDLPEGLDVITKLKPRLFDWKEAGKGTNQVGFIAQEVEEIKPEWVHQKEDIKLLSSNLPDTIPYLIKAIQEQQDIIEDLKSRIETLEG